jgi:hypothetical protein
MARQLPHELISLVHHIALNEAGWHRKTLASLTASALWLSDHPLSQSELKDALVNDLSLSVTNEEFQLVLKSLEEDSRIAVLPDGRIKLMEQHREQLNSQLKQFDEVESGTRTRFLDLAHRVCPPSTDVDKLWKSFRQDSLLPMIRNMGAKTYEMLGAKSVEEQASHHVAAFLTTLPETVRPAVKELILLFLDPQDPSLRAFILGYSNFYLCLDAGQLDNSSLQSVIAAAERKTPLYLIADTNFLFSVLQLHDNPANEAATSLMELINKARAHVEIRVYVLPDTIAEAKEVLLRHKQHIIQYRPSSNISAVAAVSELSGITKRYFQEAAHNTRLTPQDYFEPYLTNLPNIARDFGIEVYNADIPNYHTRQDVVDDLYAQLQRQEQLDEQYEVRSKAQLNRKVTTGQPKEGNGNALDGTLRKHPKSYFSLQHDITLWHVACDCRAGRIGNKEAGYLIVSIDHRFMAFDQFKCRRAGMLPLVISPAALVQRLSFYVPRSIEFEEAMIDNIRLPFLFNPYDPKAEEVILRILSRLSYFENIERLSVQTIASILLDDALRVRVASVDPVAEKEIELIHEALVEHMHRLEQERAAEAQAARLQKEKANQLSSQLAEKTAMIEKSGEMISASQDRISQLDSEVNVLKDRLGKSEKASAAFGDQVSQLRSQEAERIKMERIRELQTFKRVWIQRLVVGVVLVPLCAGRLAAPFGSGGFWLITSGMVGAMAIIWILLCVHCGKKKTLVETWSVYRWLVRFRVYIILPMVIPVVLGIVAIFAADWLKEVFKQLSGK